MLLEVFCNGVDILLVLSRAFIIYDQTSLRWGPNGNVNGRKPRDILRYPHRTVLLRSQL